MVRELRYACRSLVKSPMFSAVAILTLALGIGANTAIFSLLHVTLLKPLPYPDPDRLVKVWGRFQGIGLPGDRNWVSAPEFRDISTGNRSFTAVAAIDLDSFNVSAGDRPERVIGASVSPPFFEILGVSPRIGRTFREDEAQPGRNTTVILSHGLWQRSFGGDSGIVGRVVRVNGKPAEIVGVMPATFAYPPDADIWRPLAFTAEDLDESNRGSHGLEMLARIKPTPTVEQARADMAALTETIIAAHPNYGYRRAGYSVVLTPLADESTADVRGALYLLMGAVACVLLIACANVANLQLVRSSARSRELAVRAALGAPRGRIVGHLLVESLVLSLAGGVAGLAVAAATLKLLIPYGATALPQIAGVALNGPVLAFTFAIAGATAVLFGTAPALHGSRVDFADALRASARATGSTPASRRARGALVAAEIAISLVLLAGAGLLARSLMRLLDVDPGFRPDGVLTLRVALPQEKYGEEEQRRAFYKEALRRLKTIPGVTSAGAVNILPLSGNNNSGTVTIDTTSVPPDQTTPEADWRPVLPGYFETMKIRLASGRFFDEHDAASSAPVAIVDETFARTYWPGSDAVGRRVKIGGPQSSSPWRTIVGVVGHVRYRTLEATSRVEIYWPELQRPWPALSFVLRTTLDPAALKRAAEREIQAIDPDQPIFAVRAMTEVMAASIARRRLATLLIGVFAGIALILATVGVYGLTAYAVAERVQELGIRLALGANPRRVVASVVGRSVLLTAIGVVVGLAGSAMLARLVSSILFDTKSADPLTFAAVTALLLLTGAAASYVPARRAARIDPAAALRIE